MTHPYYMNVIKLEMVRSYKYVVSIRLRKLLHSQHILLARVSTFQQVLETISSNSSLFQHSVTSMLLNRAGKNQQYISNLSNLALAAISKIPAVNQQAQTPAAFSIKSADVWTRFQKCVQVMIFIILSASTLPGM